MCANSWCNVVGAYVLLEDGNAICIRCGSLLAQTFQQKHDSVCPGPDVRSERLRDALETIAGPEDAGPWIEVYRSAGGGYAGLQAIARAALQPPDPTEGSPE